MRDKAGRDSDEVDRIWGVMLDQNPNALAGQGRDVVQLDIGAVTRKVTDVQYLIKPSSFSITEEHAEYYSLFVSSLVGKLYDTLPCSCK